MAFPQPSPQKEANFKAKNRASHHLPHSPSLPLPPLSMELDDDVFFADLSKQIALLITEDDEDDVQRMKFPQQYLPVPVQGYYAHFPQIMTPPFYAYEHTCIRESRGTGVFIPKSSLPRRKPKQPKPHSSAAIHQTKQFSITAAGVSEISAGADHAALSNRSNSGRTKELHVYRTG